MITLFRPMSERSNLGRRRKRRRRNQWLTAAVTPDGFSILLLQSIEWERITEGGGSVSCAIQMKDFNLSDPYCHPSIIPESSPGAVVDDNVLLRGSSDGIVMLEEGDGPPCVHQQGIV